MLSFSTKLVCIISCFVFVSNSIYCCGKCCNRDEKSRGEDLIKLRGNSVNINYYDVLFPKDCDDAINVNDEEYLKMIVKEIYESKNNNKNCNDFNNIILEFIKKIEDKIVEILDIKDDAFLKTINTFVTKIFVRINDFCDNIFVFEGVKDRLLLCFLLKRIYSVLNVVANDNNNTINKISNKLSFGALISKYDKNLYVLKKDDNVVFEYIPGFTDETLFDSVSDILNYIKSCFFVYVVFVGNRVMDVFPMLSSGNIEENKPSEDIFKNEKSNVDISFFLKKIEKAFNISKKTYIYCQVLNSTIEMNNKLYLSLDGIKPNNVFVPVGDLNNEYSYFVHASDDYLIFYDKISELKSHKLYNPILDIFKKKVELKNSKTDKNKKKVMKVVDLFKFKSTKRPVVTFDCPSTKMITEDNIYSILGVGR